MEDFDITSTASGVLDSASQYGMILVWLIILAGIIGAIVYFASFKHKVVIRTLTKNGNPVPMYDKAREVVIDGGKFWRLLKRKDVIPIPPSNALIAISSPFGRGYYCEFSWSDETGYIPLEYDVTTENFHNKVIVTKQGKIIQEGFQPFTTIQRSLYVAQLRRAESRRKKDIFEKITQLAVPMILAMLFIVLLVFWEDVAKPGKEMAQANAGMIKEQEKMLTALAEISAQNARIVTAYTGKPINITQTIGGVS